MKCVGRDGVILTAREKSSVGDETSLGVNLFRADESRAISLSGKLKSAAYNPTCLATVLPLCEI